jgi:glycosyltransferase involved in cell wall biosynthesis
MADLPRISIVINSFNQADYLEQTLHSVIEQNYPNLELLVVDGGSTDGSVEIIQRYAEHITWWITEKDSGQADGINKGLRHATGEVTAWLNSDDFYYPGAVQQAAEAFLNHPEAGLIYGDVMAVDASGKPFHRMKTGDVDVEGLMTFHILNQPAVFMRRSILKSAGVLDPSYHYLLDHQLWLRIAVRSRVVHIPKLWAAGRFHPAAKNVARAADFGAEAFRIADWLFRDPYASARAETLAPSIRAGAYRMDARYLLDSGASKQALASYWKGFLSDPMVVLPETHRMLYTVLSLAGLSSLKKVYLRLRALIHPVR